MESYLTSHHYDLVTPDGFITDIQSISDTKRLATVKIKHISPAFVGYEIEPELVYFNVKSTLAQLGLNGVGCEYQWDQKTSSALVKVELIALGELAKAMLALLEPGAYIGKLFAGDERRRVRDPDYLMRMFGRSDRKGRPLLSLGGLEGSGSIIKWNPTRLASFAIRTFFLCAQRLYISGRSMQESSIPFYLKATAI